MTGLYPILFVVVASAGLLVAEYRGSELGKWINKPIAAVSYVAYAVLLGAVSTPYGRWLLGGLWACLLGDLLLIPTADRRWLKAGIVAFLVAHLFYIVAFFQRPMAVVGLASGLGLALTLTGSVGWWLRGRLPIGMGRLVALYMLVISAMLVAAWGAAVGSGRLTIGLGALLFAISDISVARDRFVEKRFLNRAWGLPLYFLAQMMLASTVAG